MLTLDNLISHRFRGFSEHENTLDGLAKALDFGVKIVEFDIRVTKCGTPVIYHDEFAFDQNRQRHMLCDLMFVDFKSLGGTFAHIPSADDLFALAKTHENTSAKLLIDIKDAGFEEEIHALVMLARLQDRTTYVSWLPNVLYRMHELAPKIPLCLSHWCQNPNTMIRSLHVIHESLDGYVPRLEKAYIHGERSGWFINKPLEGELRDIIIKSKGAVCVPQHMITRELVDNYHGDDIIVSTYAYVNWPNIKIHEQDFNIDLYFIDNKKVFDDL